MITLLMRMVLASETLSGDRPLITLDGSEVSLLRGDRDPASLHAEILFLQVQLLPVPIPLHRELPSKHSFLNGMYMREMFIPRDTLVIGRIYRDTCMCVVAAGDINVLTETGVRRIQAGFTGLLSSNELKIVYSHADTLLIGLFRTDETDLEQLDANLRCNSYGPLIGNDAILVGSISAPTTPALSAPAALAASSTSIQ